LTPAHPEIPRLWFRLGTSPQEVGQLDRALEVYQKALAAALLTQNIRLRRSSRRKRNWIRLSSISIRLCRPATAKPEQLSSDPHLEVLRSLCASQNSSSKANHNVKAVCVPTGKPSNFDSWLGERNVETTNGAVPAGQSKIERILADCVIPKNWRSNGNPTPGALQHLQFSPQALGPFW